MVVNPSSIRHFPADETAVAAAAEYRDRAPGQSNVAIGRGKGVRDELFGMDGEIRYKEKKGRLS